MRYRIFVIWLISLAIITAGCAVVTPVTGPATVTPQIFPGSTGNVPASTKSFNPPVKGTFIEGTYGGEAETLNWILAADASSFGYAGQTLDSLATYDNNFEVVLRHLAQPVQVSADGLTYTMTIRDDLKWSDGSPVTADDYVYTLKNLMFSDWLNYPYKGDWQEEVNGEEVFVAPAVVNKTTFTIKRQTVNPEFIDNVIYGMTPYPKYLALKYEGDIKAFTQAPEFNDLSYTGNLGPYRFREWIRNDKFVTDRNAGFYLGQADGSPYFEQYEIKLFETSTTVLAALEAGDVTNAGIEPAQVARFRQLPDIQVYTNPTSGYDLVLINQRANGWEGLKKKEVRQALAMSVNKQLVIDAIRNGFADPAFSFIPRPSPWYTDENVPKLGLGDLYDREKAKRLLMGAGYGLKNADGTIKVQDKDGKPIKLTIVTTPGGSISENLALLVKQELSVIGIEVEVKLVPWATLLRQFVMNKKPGSTEEPRYNNGPDAVSEEAWDMIIMALNTQPIAPSGSRVFFTTSGGLNYFGYANPKTDELFKRVSGEEGLDTGVRKQLYAEISRTIAEDQPAIFLTFPRSNQGFQSNVRGIDPGMRLSWNYHKWYFAPP
jgi:peptide/nickel transport system substrate-binding protein